jgi:hypothetical protein
MMVATVVNLVVEQGATFRNKVVWQECVTNAPIDLTNYTARMMFRASPASAIVIVSLTDVANTHGQILIPATGGVLGDGSLELYINDSTTDTMSGGGAYDLELVAPNGDVTRLMQGKFTVSPQVTK